MEQTGIEPVSPDLQSGALTNFATVPKNQPLSRVELDLERYTPRASRYTIGVFMFVNPRGFEPLSQESKSCMLPLHHRFLCKPNRIRTRTLKSVALRAIRYIMGLIVEALGVEPKSLMLKACCSSS